MIKGDRRDIPVDLNLKINMATDVREKSIGEKLVSRESLVEEDRDKGYNGNRSLEIFQSQKTIIVNKSKVAVWSQGSGKR
ncbi:hypothetical protein NPIL_129021 [Nephila pilipes]|uniref:Uncharacterized protein n=1 Tax=Nephila pilipes TaxID=299642 RepID=A0A8X6U3E7_NEPPI|nr:hypothetical protein NPIL_129021 [Nephila pilipes]